MTRTTHRLLVAAVCLVVSGALSSAFAQPRQGRGQGAMMYDPSTEARFSGIIEAVETVAGPGRRGLGGTHLTLKTPTETLEVHLGPTAFLNEKNVTLVKGDAVDILGSRVTIGDKPVLLAKEVKKGDNAWTLRDSSGRPLWSRGRK